MNFLRREVIRWGYINLFVAPLPLPLRDNRDLCLHFISLIFLPTHQPRSSVKKRAISSGFSREQQILQSKHYYFLITLTCQKDCWLFKWRISVLVMTTQWERKDCCDFVEPLKGWPSVLGSKRNGCISGSATWISSTEQSLFMISQWRTWSPDLGDLRTFP